MPLCSSDSSVGFADKYAIFERLRKHFWGPKLEEIDAQRSKLEQINRQRSKIEKSNRSHHELPGNYSLGIKDLYVTGNINQTVVEAFPDTGARTSFISSDLVSHLGLHPVPGTQLGILLANKAVIKSPGMVKIPWKFAGEQETHILTCWILPGCTHDLVLGQHFLDITHTLTTFSNRIKRRLREVTKRFSLNFMGDEKQRLRGHLNGYLTAALPDTGSDAMFINRSYAQKLGLDIDCDVRNQVEVEFPDGSTTMTSGIARDLRWTVGRSTVRCDFYVLERLCVDVILSHDYLFDLNIFSEQKEYFFKIHSKDDFFYFCNVRLVKKKRFASYNAFSLVEQAIEELEMLEMQEELYRRDKNRDEIMTLPKDQQEAAVQAENERQQRWEASRTERKAEWKAKSHITAEVLQSGLICEGSRWSRWKKRIRICIFLQKSQADRTPEAGAQSTTYN